MKSPRTLIILLTLLILIGLAFGPGDLYAQESIFLGRPTDESITANIIPNQNGEISFEYGTASGDYGFETSAFPCIANEPVVAVIGGLAPDTLYYYRLRYRANSGDPWIPRDEHSFRTQRAPGSTFIFTIVSDSHINFALGSPAVYRQTLDNIAISYPSYPRYPDFHLDLGDTFAMDSVTSDQGALSAYLVQRSSDYMGRISHSVPIFLAAGNHEQTEGWHRADNLAYWSTNARKHYFLNPIPDTFYSGNTDSSFTAISGNDLLENYYAWTWGDALFVVIDPFWYTATRPYSGGTGGGEGTTGSGDIWDWTLGQAQYNWLRETLANSNAKYKFLFMHHMTGSSNLYIRGGAYAVPYGEWGGANFNTERPGWYAPIHQVLVENGVSAVFHGHDHQYAYEMRDGIVYQSVPAPQSSGFNYYSEGGYTIRVLGNPGHLRVTVSPSQTTVDYIAASGGGINHTYPILPDLSLYGDTPTFDCDVDGSDLAGWIVNGAPEGMYLTPFAANFGKNSCQ